MRCEQCGAADGGRRKASEHSRSWAHLQRAAVNRAAARGDGALPPAARALARERGVAIGRLWTLRVDGAGETRSYWRGYDLCHRDELESLAMAATEACGEHAPTARALRAVVAAVDLARAGMPFVWAFERTGRGIDGAWADRLRPLPARSAAWRRGLFDPG